MQEKTFLILSGLMASRLGDVTRSYVNEGLIPGRAGLQSEWAALEFIPAGGG